MGEAHARRRNRKIKTPDLTAADLDAAVRTVPEVRALGITVDGVNMTTTQDKTPNLSSA